MLESLTSTGEVAPYTTTTTQPVDATRSEWSKKQMSPEARADLRKWLDAQDAQEQAAASPTSSKAMSAADVEAKLASEENSRKNVARAELAAQPDPFDAPAAPVPTMGGRPTMSPEQMQQAAAPPHPDRPYTSQQFNATPEMRGPQTLDQAKDEAAAYKAQVEARLAKQHAEDLARIEAERQKRLADAMAKSDAASAEYAKAGAALYEEPSMFKRLGTAIALGLGAYGAGLTGGPNYAMQILQNQQQRDMELKKMRIEIAAKRMAAAGASREQIEDWAKQQDAHLLTIQKAQLEALETDVNKRLAAFPQAQAAAAQKFAELKEKNAKERFQAIEAATAQTQGGVSSNEGVKVSTVEGKQKQQGRSGPTESEAKLSLLGKSMQDELKAIRKGEALTSDDLDTLQSDTLRSESADKAAESGGQIAGAAVGVARQLGAAPRSRYSSLPSEKQKTANAWDNAIEKYARMLTGAGMPAEEARRMARQNGPMAGDTPEQVEFKLQRLEREAERMVNLSGPVAEQRVSGSPAKNSEKPQPSAPKAKTEPPSSSKEMARRVAALPSGDQAKAIEAMRVKKSDPRFESADKWLRNRGLR